MNVKKEKERYDQYSAFIQNLTSSNLDISRRTIKGKDGEATILFIKQLTDRTMLAEYVIRPMMLFLSENKALPSPEVLMNSIIEADDCRLEQNQGDILQSLLGGFAIILFSQEEAYLILNIKSVEKKPVEKPELSFALRAPGDCFNENLDTNLSLIRYRIKDPAFKIHQMEVGRRTRTRVAVCYIEDIANEEVVKEVADRIGAIDVDGIVESGELQMMLLNKQSDIFPQMGIIERSDMACGALLEGKVIVVVEGSGLALVAPKVFVGFLQSCEDNYDNKYLSMAMKALRFFCVMAFIILSPIFIAISSFNFDILPTDYAIAIAMSRVKVPFNALIGTIMLETILEILREALIRVPKPIGPAIGIVGATIIGQAAIAAGIFSPLALILVSVSFLASFVAPDYTIMNPMRVLKIIIIVMTSMFGFIGFALGLCVITTMLISNSSFGVPYLAPIAPFNRYDFLHTFFYSKRNAPLRPGFLKTKDKKRI